MASPETAAAIVGGIAGVITGGITSVVAPWVKWGIEKRRSALTRREARIAEWRGGVELLRSAEGRHGIPVPIRPSIDIAAPFDVRPRPAQYFTPDEDLINVDTKTWYRTLQPLLTDRKRDEIEALNRQSLDQRKGVMPRVLTDEINRIERDVWELV